MSIEIIDELTQKNGGTFPITRATKIAISENDNTSVKDKIDETNLTLATHIDDTIPHVTSTDKTNWNDKYTKSEVDNKISAVITNLDWKESVATYADIATTYPTPEDGWAVNAKDTDITYRYNGTTWISISANAIPMATESVDGKMSSANYTKLQGISANAKKVEPSLINGNIKIDGTETNVYTHPTSHNPSIIAQDANNRFVTDAEISAWNAKANQTDLELTSNKIGDLFGSGLTETDLATAIKNDRASLSESVKLGYENTSISNMKQRMECMFVNVLDFGAKGDGTTDDSTSIQNTINAVQAIGEGVVFIPNTVSGYKMNTGITFDVSKISILGNHTVLDFSGLADGSKAITITSSSTYITRYKNVRKALDGFILKGGTNTTKINSTGLFIGTTDTTTNDGINNFSIQNTKCQGFVNNVEFVNNAWRIHFINFNSKWGNISVPAGLVNTGENTTFENCMFADASSKVIIGTGFFHFKHCSFDNCTVQAIGDCNIHINNSHFENPLSSKEGYRYVSIEHNESAVFISDTDIILNGPSTGKNFNKAIFYIIDTNTYKGLHLENLKLFQSPKYQPYITDGIQTLVAGDGRVTFSGGMTSWNSYNGYAISKSMNVIFNGDAESGNTNGWTIGGTGQISTTVYKNGTKSFYLSATAGTSVSFSQKFNVKPSQWLTGQFWRKFTTPNNGQMFTQISYYTYNDTLISTIGFSSKTATEDWGLKTYTDIVPVGASYAKLIIQVDGGTAGNEGWFDDVIINLI